MDAYWKYTEDANAEGEIILIVTTKKSCVLLGGHFSA